ncbi:tail assembly chaperone [Staphylococcus saprophyticus]|uniref:tail assembly chaperone n=1 Tax=Staphylococcus saprophyticus TaxID=29385 RepID=UPI0034DDC4EC
MEIKFNGKELELSFGLGFLNDIDRDLGFEAEQMSIGEGLNMLVPKLSNGNVVALAKIIKAATAHHKKHPKTNEELEPILEGIAENEGIQPFCDDVIKELGKKPLTQNLVPDEYKETKKKEK